MDSDTKPKLSKLAVLSLVIPSLLTVSPYILLRLFICIFGHFPSDRVNAVVDRIGALFHLNSASGFAETIPTVVIVFSAVALAIPAIFHVRNSRGVLRGYLWPIASLILIPLYFLESFFLTVFLFADMFW